MLLVKISVPLHVKNNKHPSKCFHYLTIFSPHIKSCKYMLYISCSVIYEHFQLIFITLYILQKRLLLFARLIFTYRFQNICGSSKSNILKHSTFFLVPQYKRSKSYLSFTVSRKTLLHFRFSFSTNSFTDVLTLLQLRRLSSPAAQTSCLTLCTSL